MLRVRYGQVPNAADHLRGPSRLATKKQRLYWHQLHPAPGGRRDPGRASPLTMDRIRPRAFPFCQLSVMDNFRSSELLVGNQPRETKPELRLDPRLVGNRFVPALEWTAKKRGKNWGSGAGNLPFLRLEFLNLRAQKVAGSHDETPLFFCLAVAGIVHSRGCYPDGSADRRPRALLASICHRLGVNLAPLELPHCRAANLTSGRRQSGAAPPPRIPLASI